MSTIQLEKMSEHVGTEMLGVDLNNVSDADVSMIKAELASRGLIVFRDQQLDEKGHIAFAQKIGPIVVNNYFPENDGYPEIAEVRKAETQMANIGGGWHTDHSYDQIPAMGSILVARELPPAPRTFPKAQGALAALHRQIVGPAARRPRGIRHLAEAARSHGPRHRWQSP